jgi:hypothetical protein
MRNIFESMIFRKTNTWNQILSLAAYADGRLHPCGTAFLVGKGLAITATHVLGQPFDRRIVDINRLDPQGFPVIALQVINRGEKTLQWRVVSMNLVPSLSDDADRPLDIAFLTLQPCGDLVPEIEDHRRFFFQLNIATPRRLWSCDISGGTAASAFPGQAHQPDVHIMR